MYLDQWPIDVKLLPARAGKAFWAVEFVLRGKQLTLTDSDLTTAVPQRKVDGVSAKAQGNDPIVLVGGDPARLNPAGHAIVSQPLPVLAGLCRLKEDDGCDAFAWDCARWVTDHAIADKAWPAAHRWQR